MRKGRTPAGFVPKPLRDRSRKNAETSLLEPIEKERNSAQTMRNRTLAARNIGFVPVPLAKRFRQAHSTKKSHGGAPSKHSNSSRIRAQVMRNSTLAARNIGFVPVPLAKRFRQAHSTKKSHGGAPSKHSNSSRIRASDRPTARRSPMEERLRNAGFVPQPCETATTNNVAE